MATRSLIKILFGLGSGLVFIVLSSLLLGGIPLSNLLPLSSMVFFILGIMYGFSAGILYLLIKKQKEDAIMFGVGFCISFLILYIFGYLAFSNFNF